MRPKRLFFVSVIGGLAYFFCHKGNGSSQKRAGRIGPMGKYSALDPANLVSKSLLSKSVLITTRA